MADGTHIAWCHATFNCWVGCTKVSAACDNCYAETWAKRSGLVKWGNYPRRRTSEAYWKQPLKWDQDARKSGEEKRVFCASLADVFDNQVDPQWRKDLWELISKTPHLTWMLLTKRPQNILKMVPQQWLDLVPHNVWYGTTVEDQEAARQRLPHLSAVPAYIRFVSVEPMLELLDMDATWPVWKACINLVICGGESGHNARSMNLEWAIGLKNQCEDAGCAFFMKQLGSKPIVAGHEWITKHRAGGDMAEWPADLQVQQMPWDVM